METHMNDQNEIKKNPNSQGTHILKSYLNALSIHYVKGGATNEVVVTAKDGSLLKVVVGEDGEGSVRIDPTTITSYDLEKSLGALHEVTRAAGYGTPAPIDRGAAQAGRVNYLDNFEDVYLRHSIFRRSPNKSDAELAPYMTTIKRCARKAMFRWRNVFQSMGFGEGDLLTAGMVYTVAFLHHYCYAEQEVDNIKLLTDYLKQRFGEMAKITYKKALNATCLPQALRPAGPAEEESSYIETYAETEESAPDEEYDEDSFTLTYSDGKERVLRVVNDGFLGLDMYLDGRLLTKGEARSLTDSLREGHVQKRREVRPEVLVEAAEESPHIRKDKAKAELRARLMALDPEQRTVLLGYAALSRDYAPDARREARKLADELVCPKCQKRVPSGATCVQCEVTAVPLLGVDYLAFREKLLAEQHPMGEAMSAHIPESEVRSRAKKPIVAVGVVALADTLKPEEIITEKTKRPPKTEKSALGVQLGVKSKAMAAELMAKLPAIIQCPKCKKHLPKEDFGIRVARDRATGIPARASRQSFCKPCRKPAK
jgi:hypothetical protein